MLRICFVLILASLAVPPVVANEVTPRTEIIHMWLADSEQKALSVFRQDLEASGVDWSDYGVTNNFKGVRGDFSQRMALGSPPTIAQWIVGRDNVGLVESGVFRAIEDVDNMFRDNLYQEVYDIVALEDGSLSALPVGIHTQNHIAYNNELLKEYGLKEAETWDELISYGPALAEKGVALIANSDETWQLRNLFISIISSVLSYEEMKLLDEKNTDFTSLATGFSRSFDILLQLRKFALPGFEGRRWEKATKAVADGHALVQVLGDYIAPEFPEGVDLVCGAVPEAKYALWGMDSFVFTATDDPTALAGHDAMLKAMLKPQNLADYISHKGGISVMHSIHPDQIKNKCIAATLGDWSQFENRYWMGGEVWRNRFAVMGTFVQKIWSQEGEVDPQQAGERLAVILDSL